jgi:hypothetical protein
LRKDNEGYIFDVLRSEDVYHHVTSMLAAYKRNEKLCESNVVVLNTWDVSAEQVVNRLSQCFAGVGGVSLDVGAKDVKDGAVLMAWRTHRLLKRNSAIFKRRADIMTVISTSLSCATTMFSVGSIVERENGEENSFLSHLTGTLIIILPAIGGLVFTALSRFQYLSKWASMHVAMEQIESEIWKFRTSTGEYDMTKQAEASDGKKQKKKDPPKKMDNSTAQNLFSSRVSQLFTQVLSSEMQQDSFYPHGADEESHGYRRLPDGEEEPQPGVDDGVSDVSGEQYYELRLLPKLQELEKRAPQLSLRRMYYEVTVLVLGLVTTILAALRFKLAIPAIVALSSMVTSFLQYEALQGRLVATNSAIAELTSFTGDWTAMGVLQRRGRLVKSSMVKLTEHAIVRVAAAYTAGAGQASSSHKKTEKEPGEEKKDEKETKDK